MPLFSHWWTLLIIAIAGIWLHRALRMHSILKAAPLVFPLGSAPSSDLVSVIIPCKNEERNIADLIASLGRQSHPAIQIIVVNDNSSDKTESILKSLGVDYVNAPPVPEGWTGKNFAIFSGIRHAKGQWLLFTDADTRHDETSIAASLAHMKKKDLKFLSLLPRCLTGSFIENLIQPFAMAMTGLWFPMDRLNRPETPVYFGNGQYLMMHSSLYESVGGHSRVRGEFLEDFALMKLSKQCGAKTEIAVGTSIYGTRMYDSFSGIRKGWRRIWMHAFQKNAAVLAQKSLAVFFCSVLPFFLPFILPSTASPFLKILSVITPFFVIAISWKGYGVVKANRWFAWLHPLAGFFSCLILIDAAWTAASGKKTVWR